LRLRCRHKDNEIAGADLTKSLGKAPIHPAKGGDMNGVGKKNEHPGKDDGKSRKSPPATTEDDDVEDGDIATPKRDRYGDDDQPL
jgi:hypothetical protein